jgi:AdoMet-dependent heme synthase
MTSRRVPPSSTSCVCPSAEATLSDDARLNQRSDLRGGWYLQRPIPHRLRAFRLEDESELELSGRLAELDNLARLSEVQGHVGSLAVAARSPSLAPTLARLFGAQGWGLLFVELTGRCNERCVHCYASSSPEVEDALEWEVIERILRQAQELGFRTIQLTGGDPLLSPHLLDAARLTRTLGLGLEIYTNGLAFRPELARELAKIEARLAFSFYSHDPKVHDQVTNTPGSQERTLRAILLGLELGMKVRVSIIATEVNGGEVDRTRAFLVERGVPEAAVRASREMSVGRGAFRANQTEFTWGGTHGTAERRLGKLAVTYQGRVVPCIFDRTIVLGDIQSESLTQIVDRDVNELSLPKRLRSASEELSCSDCKFRRNLLGG